MPIALSIVIVALLEKVRQEVFLYNTWQEAMEQAILKTRDYSYYSNYTDSDVDDSDNPFKNVVIPDERRDFYDYLRDIYGDISLREYKLDDEIKWVVYDPTVIIGLEKVSIMDKEWSILARKCLRRYLDKDTTGIVMDYLNSVAYATCYTDWDYKGRHESYVYLSKELNWYSKKYKYKEYITSEEPQIRKLGDSGDRSVISTREVVIPEPHIL